jgi:adenylate cyclase
MRYQFDGYELDTDRYELTRNGSPIQVEPQVIELLQLLIGNRDRMVSKDEINEVVWQGRVVSEAALSSRIKTARQLLGDDGRTQKVIRTIHKKGFRFVAEVSLPQIENSAALTEPATSSMSKPAVAVLPFANLSSDTEQEYLSDGITADIITNLSKHRWLDVAARNLTFGYKHKEIDIHELGKQLKVNYIVSGSVQRAGNRIRVSVYLVDAVTNHQKWADRYDREMEDIFSLQDDVTETIAARLEPEIGFSERKKIVHSRPSNLKAWDSYHLGMYHLFKFTGPDNTEAQRLLRQSQELDPYFGEPYAWWAYAIIFAMVYWDTKPDDSLLDAALAACDKALSLDDRNATFYALKARVLLARREYKRAIAENETAIRLNSTLAAAHCGLGDSLAYEGMYGDAIDCFENAIRLSPNDPQLWAFYTYGALTLLFQGKYNDAIEWCDHAHNIPNCQYWTTAHKIVAYAYLDNSEAVGVEKIRLARELPEFSLSFAREKLFYLQKQEQIDLYIEGLRRAGIPEIC